MNTVIILSMLLLANGLLLFYLYRYGADSLPTDVTCFFHSSTIDGGKTCVDRPVCDS